jgi:hypothetical protein
MAAGLGCADWLLRILAARRHPLNLRTLCAQHSKGYTALTMCAERASGSFSPGTFCTGGIAQQFVQPELLPGNDMVLLSDDGF